MAAAAAAVVMVEVVRGHIGSWLSGSCRVVSCRVASRCASRLEARNECFPEWRLERLNTTEKYIRLVKRPIPLSAFSPPFSLLPSSRTCNIRLIINVVGMLCSRVNSGIARRDELEAGSCLPDCLASF